MNGRGGPPPSPPISIARSSNGTSLYPTPGPEGGPGGPPAGRKYNMQQLEAQLADHHRVLKDYLAESLRQDKTYMPHNRARDKLLRLSAIQFQELSTDVYDELLRREDERVAQEDGRNVPRFLLPKNNFHPKRNQARQKLSTLAQKKFRELATDVLFELERRFPRFTGAERVANRGASRPPTAQGFHGMRRPSNASSIGGSYSPSIVDNPGRATPGPRQFQSNTMVPNKGRMVEDDDDASVDDDDPYGFARRSSRRTTNRSLPYSMRENSVLEAKVEELENQVVQKDKALEEERERSSKLASELETQLKSAHSFNESLQGEVDRMRANREAEDWKEKYQGLQQEFRDFHEAAENMRQETASSMQEIRSLTTHIHNQQQAEEELAKQNTELKEQLEDWKARHAKTRAHLRTLKASSSGLFIQQPTAAQYVEDGSILDARGAIKDVSVTRFQLAVDELLQLLHDGEVNNVLVHLQQLVTCVRAITSDVSKTNPRGPEDFIKRRKKLEARIAATTNHLITVCKNHASANGLAPVALVDSAASHLTAGVVDYIKMMKVKPSPEGELDGGDFRR